MMLHARKQLHQTMPLLLLVMARSRVKIFGWWEIRGVQAGANRAT